MFLLLPWAGDLHRVCHRNRRTHTSHFANFFGQTLLRESFMNSLTVALASVFFASVIAIPLAYLTVRFEFRGAADSDAGVLPLIMPPFVGAGGVAADFLAAAVQ